MNKEFIAMLGKVAAAAAAEKETRKYTVKVYVTHGYFEYKVDSMSSALEHAHLIMEKGVYRRSNERGEVECHTVIKTKVCGLNLKSEYPDTFRRT